MELQLWHLIASVIGVVGTLLAIGWHVGVILDGIKADAAEVAVWRNNQERDNDDIRREIGYLKTKQAKHDDRDEKIDTRLRNLETGQAQILTLLRNGQRVAN